MEIHNPANLTDRQVEDLERLQLARIDIFSALHHCQDDPILIDTGRVLQDTFVYAPIRGTLHLKTPAGCFTVSPGKFILLTAGQPHGVENPSGKVEIAAVHGHIRMGNAPADQPLFDGPVRTHTVPAYWHQKLDRLISLASNRTTADTAREILRELLMEQVYQGSNLLPCRESYDPRIEQSILLMKDHLADPWPLEAYGQAVGLASSQFRLLFRRETGSAPKDYLRNLRLEEALRRLRNPLLSVKEVAGQLSYAGPQHLIKQFKAIFGMTPGQYRKHL